MVVNEVEKLYMQNMDPDQFKISNLDQTIFAQDVISLDCLDLDCDKEIVEYLTNFQDLTEDFDPNTKRMGSIPSSTIPGFGYSC